MDELLDMLIPSSSRAAFEAEDRLLHLQVPLIEPESE